MQILARTDKFRAVQVTWFRESQDKNYYRTMQEHWCRMETVNAEEAITRVLEDSGHVRNGPVDSRAPFLLIRSQRPFFIEPCIFSCLLVHIKKKLSTVTKRSLLNSVLKFYIKKPKKTPIWSLQGTYGAGRRWESLSPSEKSLECKLRVKRTF